VRLQSSLGGVLCTECFRDDVHDCFSLGPGAQAGLRALLEQPLDEAVDISLEEATLREVEMILARVLSHHAH